MQKILIVFGTTENLFEGNVVNVVDYTTFMYPTDPNEELRNKISQWLQTTDTREFIKDINKEIETRNFLTTHEVKIDPTQFQLINVTGLDDDMLLTFLGLSARCTVKVADNLIKKMYRDEIITYPKTYVMTFKSFDTYERLYVKVKSFFEEDQLLRIRSEMNIPTYSHLNNSIHVGEPLGIYEIKESSDHVFVYMLEKEYITIKNLNSYIQSCIDAQEKKLLK